MLSNTIGFDDAPLPDSRDAPIPLVGAVFAGPRLDGVVAGRLTQDGPDATAEIARLVAEGKYAEHLQLVMLQGVTFAGFNVVDVPLLHEVLGLPILVVSDHQPDLPAMRRALLQHVANGKAKWRIIESLGPMEPVGGVFVQRAGISEDQAAHTIERFTINGRIPEPLRVAHLIASAFAS